MTRSRSLSDLWATPAMVRRTLVAVGVQTFTQFSGINGESLINDVWSRVDVDIVCASSELFRPYDVCCAWFESLTISTRPRYLRCCGTNHEFLVRIHPRLILYFLTTTISTISSFITLVLDTVGRKKPLMFGAASFVVTYSVLSAIVASFPPETSTNHPAQRAGIAMIFLTSIFFSVSFGPVSWTLASEVRWLSVPLHAVSQTRCFNQRLID